MTTALGTSAGPSPATADPDEDAATDPARWTVATVTRALQAGRVSPEELVEVALDRIAALDPSIGAFAHLRVEDARADARASARRWARGAARGPLDGVPVAVKDLGDRVAGVPVTLGCRAVVARPAPGPSPLVERLQSAGAVVVGTTNVPELGHRATTDNELRGPTRSPFASDLNAGGSSGGSAAAVAAGMVPAALGSDGAGSVRVPAALCGVVGLKPTFGRIASPTRPNAFRTGALAVSPGPLTRTVADSHTLLDLLSGPHPGDPFSLPPPVEPLVSSPDRPLRIGLTVDMGGFPVEPAVAAAVRAAGEALAAAGHRVEPADLRLPLPHDELCAVVRRAVGLTLADAVDGLVAEGALRTTVDRALAPTLRALVDEARATTTDGWRADGVARTQLLATVEQALAPVDVVLGPVLGVAAVPNAAPGATIGPAVVAGTAVDPGFGWCLTWPFNLTGHPAVAVPAGRSGAEPRSVQIVGRRFADGTVLAAAAALERVAPWHPWYLDVTTEGGRPCIDGDTSPAA